MPRFVKLFLWILVYLAVGFGIGQATQGSIDSWYATLNKPSFNPPNWIFPVMWSLLYVCIATAGWRLWDVQASRKLKITFGAYTILNWFWTPIFFGAQMITGGLVWIALINICSIYLISRSWKQVKLTALLMIPVTLWTLFAMVLNYNIWALNS